MKRLPTRELLLVGAPLSLICLGIWGAQLRERFWPTRPHVVSCTIRPATPLEISQGAQVGVTITAVEPHSPNFCGSLDYRPLLSSPSHFTPPKEAQEFTARSPVLYEFLCDNRGTYDRHEVNVSYKWTRLASWEQPLAIQAQMRFACSTFPSIKQNFELTTQGIVRPDPEAVRRANFRLVKATLLYGDSAFKPTPSQRIRFEVQDISNENQESKMTARCIGWNLQGGKKHQLYAKADLIRKLANTYQVTVHLDTQAMRYAAPKGTKIIGLLSVNNGWPQEVELEWPLKPKQLSQPALVSSDSDTEMKFTTKLAPLPPKE